MDTSLHAWQNANKTKLSPPTTAWPTVILFLLALCVFIGSTYLTIYFQWPVSFGIISNTISQFMLFTVLHDASHRSVSQTQWFNEILGSISAFILSPLAGIRVFRFVHMQHHRFTNAGSENDPDEWCGKGKKWTLPLRWMTLDLHYFFWYRSKWATRPQREKLELILTSLGGLGLVIYWCCIGYGAWTFLLWLAPSRLATAWLALAFDYLPHYPHDYKASDNELKATNIKPQWSWLMTPLFLCQNYHLIHHLYPRIPFYKYPWVWKSAHKDLIHSGARIMTWGGKDISS